MDGQLVQVCLPSHFLPGLASPVENLSPKVDELRAEVHRLQAENHEFRQQAGYWKSRHRDALKRITALERKVEPTPMVLRALMAAWTPLFSTSRTQQGFSRYEHLEGDTTGVVDPDVSFGGNF